MQYKYIHSIYVNCEEKKTYFFSGESSLTSSHQQKIVRLFFLCSPELYYFNTRNVCGQKYQSVYLILVLVFRLQRQWELFKYFHSWSFSRGERGDILFLFINVWPLHCVLLAGPVPEDVYLSIEDVSGWQEQPGLLYIYYMITDNVVYLGFAIIQPRISLPSSQAQVVIIFSSRLSP